MGLEEKRLIKDVQEKNLPAFQAKIKSIVGADIPVEVLWDSFNDSANGLKSLPNTGFEVVAEGLKYVCKDDLGKSAVKESLKKIVFKQNPTSGKLNVTMDGGVLTSDQHFGAGEYVSSSKIQGIIEKGL